MTANMCISVVFLKNPDLPTHFSRHVTVHTLLFLASLGTDKIKFHVPYTTSNGIEIIETSTNAKLKQTNNSDTGKHNATEERAVQQQKHPLRTNCQ